MVVTPTFYKTDGTAIVADPVRVQAAEIRYDDLKKLIPGRYRNNHDWGGMSLAYYGVTREIWAQLRFLGVNGGSSVDEFFSVPQEVRTDLQQAVWWMPQHSSATIALGNITNTATSATVQFGDGQTQAVNLAPHATQIIRHVPRSQATSESVIISITGAAGSVIPTGIIAADNGTFNSVIRFYETKSAKQPHLFGNGLRLAGMTPHMMLKNTSSTAITAAPQFIPLGGAAAGKPVTLPTIALKPLQATEVDLGPLMNAVRRRSDLDTVSVEVTNSGTPGSLIGALYSSNNTSGVDYDVPLRDSGPARAMTGAYPWKVSDDFTTMVYITNISDGPTQFVAQINFDSGKYVIDPRKLAPGETAVFDLREMITEQKPDNAKRYLPKNAQIGQFKWVVRGVTGGKVILMGRAEMVSRSQQISTSYSCAEDCVAHYWGGITPTSMVAAVGSTHAMSAWEVAENASGSRIGPYGANGTWSSDHTNIATVDSNGSCAAVATGQAGIEILSDWVDYYYWDGLDCLYGGRTQWNDSSGVTVLQITFQKSDGTSLPSTLGVGITAKGVTDSTNHDKTQHLKAVVDPSSEAANITLSVSSKLQLSNAQTSGNTITFDVVGTTKSDNQGDQTITATHTAGTTFTKQVSVVIPSKVGTPHDTTGSLVIANRDLNIGTRPALINVPLTQVGLVTLYGRDLTITVLDQFGNSLGNLYQNATVEELDSGTGSYFNINSPLTATGTYRPTHK